MNSVGIAQSGLAATALRVSTSASNLANIDDTSPVDEAGYQPLTTQNTALPGGGVSAQVVTLKPASYQAYDPTSPIADAQGMVDKPQIDPINEIANLIQGGQAYAFQLKTMQVAEDEENTIFDTVT
jgi:flagellar basal-body rod protein FlgC